MQALVLKQLKHEEKIGAIYRYNRQTERTAVTQADKEY